jgi:hypothetical protein
MSTDETILEDSDMWDDTTDPVDLFYGHSSPILDNPTLYEGVVAGLLKGQEYYSPDGRRLMTVEDISDVFNEFGKVLGPSYRRLEEVKDDSGSTAVVSMNIQRKIL